MHSLYMQYYDCCMLEQNTDLASNQIGPRRNICICISLKSKSAYPIHSFLTGFGLYVFRYLCINMRITPKRYSLTNIGTSILIPPSPPPLLPPSPLHLYFLLLPSPSISSFSSSPCSSSSSSSCFWSCSFSLKLFLLFFLLLSHSRWNSIPPCSHSSFLLLLVFLPFNCRALNICGKKGRGRIACCR